MVADQDVRRLQISVNIALAVHVVETLKDLEAEVDDLLRQQAVAIPLFDVLFKVRLLDVVKDENQKTFVFFFLLDVSFVQIDDVRVVVEVFEAVDFAEA